MKRRLFSWIFFAILTLPVIAPAQSHEDHDDQTMHHQGSQPMMEHKGDHDAKQQHRTRSLMVGEQTIDGVKAMVHLNDVGAMMAEMGMRENYHFMIMFTDAATGQSVEQGTVAVKITEPKTGQPGEAIPLMGMGGHFGADVLLSAKGEYTFVVGSKLADGKKRQFTFVYTLH
jgi:hypothetical protein